MALKYVILAALVAVAKAGYLGGYAAAPVAYAAPAAYAAPVAVTSQHSNILRSYGNLGQVSTYSKTIDTPYSSVRKSDVRVSNDALAYSAPAVAAVHAPVAYAAPASVAYQGAYAAPAVAAYQGYAAPYAARYAAPAAVTSQHSNILRSYGNLGQVSTYSKTIDTPYSSVRKSDVRVSNDALAYSAPAVAAVHAPVAYAAPAVAAYQGYAAPYAARYAAPVAAAHGLLGVAYSAAPAVAHLSYSNAYGINYAY